MISARKWEALRRKMATFGIKESDLDEKFVRSSGPGGQNVNKVSSRVMLHHRPTGMRVSNQESRSQGDNRYYARRILVERMDEKIRGRESAAAKKRHKIRQQKRKRSKRAKAKMRQNKAKRAEKKRLRATPGYD